MSANTKKPHKEKRPPFHEEFANKIIERLQEGTAPWQVPWTPGKASLAPHNPASGTVYRGMNRVHLALSGYDDPRWMTLKQANDHGYSILPGSKATPVVYFQFSEEKDKLDKEGKPVLDADGKPEKEKVDVDGNLLVPVMTVDKELRGLQTISPEGEKRFMYGMEKNGNFHLIAGDNTPLGKDLSQGEIILAEGYATGATLHMATEKPVAVAFDAGNLEPVAKKLREKFPNAAITICADNDHQYTRRTPEGVEPWNKGVELAQKAAQEVGGKVVVPIFTDEERGKGLTDFNDLHQSRGLDEVKRQVNFVLQKDVEREKSRFQGLERGISF